MMNEHGFHYVTAISKAQINKLLSENVITMELFDDNVCEVIDEGTRYMLRRNPIRAKELSENRNDKLEAIKILLAKENEYLTNHNRASSEKALERVSDKIKRLKCHGWLSVTVQERSLSLQVDKEALAQDSKLDGCYVIKTDLAKDVIGAQEVHDRYKELALVEWAFRTEKTTHLEVRPIYVQSEKSTYGHVFVVMLAYMIVKRLTEQWKHINLKVAEGLELLSKICAMEMNLPDIGTKIFIPRPSRRGQELLDCIGLELPMNLVKNNVPIKTRKRVRKSVR